MQWTVETVAAADAEIESLPTALRARLVRLLELIESVGLEELRPPHVRRLDGKLWELRVRAAGGARGIYVHGKWETGGGRARLREEDSEDTAPSARNCEGENETGDRMTKLKDLKHRFMEDPEFREEYARADAEYALVEELVRARSAAKLTQAQLAERIGTTQSAIARLESGRVSPSFATLRRYAEATGTRLTIGLQRVDG